MKLYYVRHGKTQGNIEGNYIGRSESPLLPEGILGAEAAGEEIAASEMRIDVIYTSRLTRQLDTAKIIASKIKYPEDNIVITDLLLERAGGLYENKPQADFFAASEDEQVAAGAESFQDLSHRAVMMVERAKAEHPDETVLLVGSAAIGEMMRAMIKYNDRTKMFDDGPLPNTELVRLI